MRQTSVFGKRREPHTVIIAHGDDIRHFTVRPWVATLAGSAVAAIAIGYLLATSYLVLRDDLIGATVARQARMQQAYEDRIAALRAQVDRITSRQLLDQQLMESKVSELLARQTQLKDRHGRLGPILDGVGTQERVLGPVPVPKPKPDDRAQLEAVPLALGSHASFAAPSAGIDALRAFWSPEAASTATESTADRADRLFVAINQSLRSIETEQVSRIRNLTEDAYETVGEISAALKTAGLSIDDSYGEAAGGPLLAGEPPASFDHEVAELDLALSKLNSVKSAARKLPIANPAPGQSISSRFGMRRDPILGIRALHSGMDFRAPTGAPVMATAPGVVVKAGWNGGYGKLVEVKHDDGFTTRYAHMSAVTVKEGQIVETGDQIGKVGNTGRSTGPHLHYEIRLESGPVDPLRFLKAGRKVEDLL